MPRFLTGQGAIFRYPSYSVCSLLCSIFVLKSHFKIKISKTQVKLFCWLQKICKKKVASYPQFVSLFARKKNLSVSSKHRSSRQGPRWRVENVLSSGKCWLLLNYQTNSHYISKEWSSREYNINVRMQQKYHISDLLGNRKDGQAEPHCTKRTS